MGTETGKFVAAVLAYLAVGAIFGALDRSLGTVFLWPFGLDIRLLYWAQILGIRRRRRREFAAILDERGRKLKAYSFEWIDEDEAKITIIHRDEMSVWVGSFGTWRKIPDGDLASDWLGSWLCDRWQEELRRCDG